MPVTAITRSDATQAIIKRTAVFLKQLRNGQYAYVREPYDIVEYDRSHQASGANKLETYYQLRTNIVRPNPAGTGYAEIGTDSTNSVEEVYDDIVFLDARPASAPNR